MRILCDKEVIVLVLMNCLCMFCTTFYTGYFSLYVKEEFEVGSTMLGLLYSLTAFAYVIYCITAPMIFKNVPSRILLTVSMYCLVIGMSLFGPSWLLSLPNKYWIMCSSSVLTGFGFCMPSILFASAVKERLVIKYKIVEGTCEEVEKRLNDLNSLMFLLA